ncbi:MAG: DUF1570 domain-containing protein [Kiritimatiellae bacterium]|nr:DUF1570 domain-containing protein [Kiritimatiellia bacterium]
MTEKTDNSRTGRCAARHLRTFLLAFLVALKLLPVLAAPSFRADKNYPAIGLRMRVLGGSAPEPLPPHKTYSYTFNRDSESYKKDLFDAHELWYATQHAGQWRDNAGNVLALGRATRLLPQVESATRHVARDDFDVALADPATEFDPENSASLSAWLKAFSGCEPQQPESLRTGFNLTHALFFPVEESATLVYAFRVKTRMPDGKSAPSDWFCAVVKINDGTLKSKTRKDFETHFLANVSALPQSDLATAAAATSHKLTAAPSAGASEDLPQHPSRAAARKSIANMKGWWYAETPEYIFLSDIRSAAGKTLVRELQKTMPALRNAFTRLIPPFKAEIDVSVVRIYEEPEAYRQYVGKTHEWSIGLWSPMRRELVVLSQGKDRKETMSIIMHEGFHQYLFYATDKTENAVWYNEGHACFFETAQIDSRGHVEIPENSRVSHLGQNFDAAVALIPKLLNFGYNEFYMGSEQQRSLNYTTAWALIYFLHKGVPAGKLDSYAGILDKYLKNLSDTKDAAAATAAAFEGVDMPRFQKDFTDFWRRGRNAARRFDLFAKTE